MRRAGRRLAVVGGLLVAALALAGGVPLRAGLAGARDLPLSDATSSQSPRGRRGLEERVRHKLVRLPFYSVFDNLEYRVDAYRVTLTGQVTRPSLRHDAEKW